MLDQDSDEPLNGAEAYPVNHNGTLLGAVLRHILSLKTLGKLEIQLNGSALPGPANGISQMEIDLRPVERAVALVDDVL